MADARLVIKIEDDTSEQVPVSPAPAAAPAPAGRAWTAAQQVSARQSLPGQPDGPNSADPAKQRRDEERRRLEERREGRREWDSDPMERLRREEEREAKRRKREEEEEEKRRRKEQEEAEKRRERNTRLGTSLGASAGRVIGTAVGGPVGTVVGGVVGGAIGRVIGSKVGGGSEDEDSSAGTGDPMAAVAEVADTATELFKVAGRSIDLFREAAVRAAGNDGFGAFKVGIDAASDAVEEIPVVGEAAAEGLRLFTKALSAADDVLHAFASRGKELGGYSADIAAASARQEIAFLKADIDEAKRLGNDYAKMIELETQWQLAWREFVMDFKKIIMELLPDALKMLADMLVLLSQIAYYGSATLFDFRDHMKALRAALDRPREPGGADLLMPLLDALGGIADPFGPRIPVRGAPAAVPPIVAEF